MRVVRVRTGRVISPWADPVGAMPIVGEALADRQQRIARSLGLVWAGDADGGSEPGTLYWHDDLDVSKALLKRFLGTRREGVLAVAERPRRSAALDSEPVLPDGSRQFGLRLGPAREPIVISPAGLTGKVRLPMGHTLDTFTSGQTATTLTHWVHVLRANLAVIVPTVVRATLLAPWSPAWSVLRFGLRAATSKVGRGCVIHPTARVEGCIIGDRVSIGSFTVLRGCIVGDDAMIEDHVTARLSVVGRAAHLANYAMFNLSVSGSRSSVGHIGAQACMIGDDTFLSTFATLQDLALVGNVKVRDGDHITDSGTPFLGSALGHRVRVGSGITVAAGREIANDTTMVSDDVVRRPPPPGAWRWAGGQWSPLS